MKQCRTFITLCFKIQEKAKNHHLKLPVEYSTSTFSTLLLNNLSYHFYMLYICFSYRKLFRAPYKSPSNQLKIALKAKQGHPQIPSNQLKTAL